MSVVSISKKRVRLNIGGIVQGVGFRPFVYQLAHELSLKGFVNNDAQGVVVEVEGDKVNLDQFLEKLRQTPPPLSRIDSLEKVELSCQDEDGFVIRQSAQGGAETMVSADISMCSACEAELKDPESRRFAYPFINCTDCGPRYSIIESLPYDRASTSMSAFLMCSACEAEYNDPSDRRYHAQPIGCHDCGPRLFLLDPDGRVSAQDEAALLKICLHIREGKTVAIKGLGGFHLVCDASNEEAVSRLRKDKRRPSKPFAVMFPDMNSIKENCSINETDESVILSRERPIVLVKKGSCKHIASSVAPGIDRLGVFLSYTPLHVLLLQRLQTPILATSANLSEEPIIIDEKSLLRKLPSVISAVLSYDREIVNACDDSVVMMAGEQRLLTRLARGFAPQSMPLKRKIPRKILALGANQKSTVALGFEDHMILSPHIGDLGSLEAFEYFERTIETFKRFYDFEPDIIVCDKHPLYQTTSWAREYLKKHAKCELIKVQHHYAHALACMAEYGLDEKSLAFCFDGTGYGDDGTLWGGEILIADPLRYERICHLRPFRLIGGEQAVKEPRRIALSLLFECFSLHEVMQMKSPVIQSFSSQELRVLHTMWQKGLNAPMSSSVGRLFDAMAAFGGLTQFLGYEGEGGLLVETAAEARPRQDHAFEYTLCASEIDYRPMIKEIVHISSADEIASKFMATLCTLIEDIAQGYPHLPIILSGGVFQNGLLVSRVSEGLKAKGRRVYIQEQTPVNDGGISLGQLYHALHLSRKKNG